MDPFVTQGAVLKSATRERHVVSASLTPASVHGVSQPRPASILLPTSQSTPMESAGTGTTVFIRFPNVSNVQL